MKCELTAHFTRILVVWRYDLFLYLKREQEENVQAIPASSLDSS